MHEEKRDILLIKMEWHWEVKLTSSNRNGRGAGAGRRPRERNAMQTIWNHLNPDFNLIHLPVICLSGCIGACLYGAE